MVDQMTKTETSREIDDIAALWAARLDRGVLGELDEASLNAWLDGDIRRLGALARAQAALVPVASLVPVPSLEAAPTISDPEPGDITPNRFPRRRIFQISAVTALAACVGGLALLPPGLDSYETARGEVRLLPLSDGSVVTLNTGSQIKIDFTANRRTVYLVEGEVLFDVAKNPARPFFVEAGAANVRAVGTAFAVRRTGANPVQVLVQKGVVEVEAPTGRKQSLILNANMKATATTGAEGTLTAQPMTSEELDRSLAWREGKIAFSDTKLKDAVVEFNRYNKTKLQVDGDDVGERTMTGLFAATDPKGFAHAVALSLDLKVQETPERIVFSEK